MHLKTLIELAENFASPSPYSDVFVSVEDAAAFNVVSDEILSTLLSRTEGELILVADAATAADRCMQVAKDPVRRLVIVGELPEGWSENEKMSVCPPPGSIRSDQRFILALSEKASMAMVATARTREGEGEPELRGGWTCLQPVVKYLGDLILADGAHDALSGLPDLGPFNEERASNLQVMAVLARHYASEQHSLTMARDDLSSVLEILRGLSAKRRTHDILYVFVEQIASAITIDRCSIVRVWGGDDHGHVLASHEDASVYDLTIDLDKYSEMRSVLATGEKVLINNIGRHPMVQPIRSELDRAGITAILVVPIVLHDENVGSFILRAVQRGGGFTERDVHFCEIVAEAAASSLERAQLFDNIQKANERLEYLAITDGLTGLHNYRYFRDRLEEEFARAVRYRLPLAVMIIDVDDFKNVNDTYGHLIGDAVLRELANRTQQSVRKNDVLARYGGEELVAILPQTSLEGARQQAERLRLQVSGSPYRDLPPDRRITVSIGVVMLDLDDMANCDALMHAADSALYAAKGECKDRVIIGGEATL